MTLLMETQTTTLPFADIRGTLGSIPPLMITVGMLFVNGVGALIHWMTLTGICIAFPGEYYRIHTM